MIRQADAGGRRRPDPGHTYIKILVIEENPESCRNMANSLHERGYQVVTSNSGIKGRLLVSQDSFHIVLLDLLLREAPWMEILEGIKRIDPRIGMIAISARADLEMARLAMRAGCRDFMIRPFTEEQLLGAVQSTCRVMGLIHTNEVEVNRAVGQRIRQARLNRSYTLRQLAELTGLTPSQLSQVELGKNAASVWALARISSALGHQISSLLNGI